MLMRFDKCWRVVDLSLEFEETTHNLGLLTPNRAPTALIWCYTNWIILLVNNVTGSLSDWFIFAWTETKKATYFHPSFNPHIQQLNFFIFSPDIIDFKSVCLNPFTLRVIKAQICDLVFEPRLIHFQASPSLRYNITMIYWCRAYFKQNITYWCCTGLPNSPP